MSRLPNAPSPKRASYSRKAFAQYMSIDLGGFYALVAKQLLYRADIRALVQKLSGEAVPQGMARAWTGK